MADPQPLWKKYGPLLLNGIGIVLVIAMVGASFAGTLAFMYSNKQDGIPTNKLFRTASGDCIKQGVMSASDGTLAYENLTGKTAKSTVDEIPFFQAAASQYQGSLALAIAVAKNESGFDPTATSSAGAMGVMQTKQGTFDQMLSGTDELSQRLRAKGPHDPEAGIYAGTKYLIYIQTTKKFTDINEAIAAYHEGPAAFSPGSGVPAAVKGYVNSVRAIYDAITKCDQNQQKSTAAGGTAAPLCDQDTPKPSWCDTSKAMSAKNLQKWIGTIMPDYITRRSLPDASAVFQPKWIIVHTTEGSSFPFDTSNVFTNDELAAKTPAQRADLGIGKSQNTQFKKTGDHAKGVYATPDLISQFVVNGSKGYQLLPYNVLATSTARFNQVSVNMEIMGFADKDLPAASVSTAAQVISYLMDKLKIASDHVISHYNVAQASTGQGGTDPDRPEVSYATIYMDYQTGPDGTSDPVAYPSDRHDPGRANMKRIMAEVARIRATK